jgi:hypothetical protein
VKSRFFSIPGLLVDVSEVVHVEYPQDKAHEGSRWYGTVLYRNGKTAEIPIADAKAIQEYVEEYEAEQAGAWMTLELPDTEVRLNRAIARIYDTYHKTREADPSMYEVARQSFGATEKTGAKGG